MLLSIISWRRTKVKPSIKIESELDSGKTTSTINKQISFYSTSKRDNDLVKMPGSCDFRVLFPQLNSPLRVSFQADSPAIFRNVKQGKHLPGHFKDQGCVIERESFSDGWFGNAVFADFFDVHI
jgi:hypothetical protein